MCDAAENIWKRFERFQARSAANSKKSGVRGSGQLAVRDLDLDTVRKQKGYIGRDVTCMLVDEAQDLLLYQILLFRCVCRNKRYYSFAADTAQCISAGRVFRFDGLKKLWWEKFNEVDAALTSTTGSPLSSDQEVEQATVDRYASVTGLSIALEENQEYLAIAEKTVPDVVNLVHNFRTHQNILDLAAEIVDILTKFWPRRIDSLPRERSDERGRRPLIVYDLDKQVFFQSLLETAWAGVERGGSDVAILVRSEEAKAEVRGLLDKNSAGRNTNLADKIPILTCGEAKGLEFAQVLIWRFLESSSVPATCWYYLWPLAEVEAKKSNHIPEVRNRIRSNRSNIDSGYTMDKLASLHTEIGANLWQNELKELYVALTRVRKTLFLFEEKASVPMLMLSHLVGGKTLQLCKDAETLPNILLKNDRVFVEQAKKLFEEGRFAEAAQKFAAAEDPYWVGKARLRAMEEADGERGKVERGQFLAEHARLLDARGEQLEFCLLAAALFEECELWEKARELYGAAIKVGMWEKTRELYGAAIKMGFAIFDSVPILSKSSGSLHYWDLRGALLVTVRSRFAAVGPDGKGPTVFSCSAFRHCTSAARPISSTMTTSGAWF